MAPSPFRMALHEVTDEFDEYATQQLKEFDGKKLTPLDWLGSAA